MKKILYIAFVAACLSDCTADVEDQQVAVEKNPISAKILNGTPMGRFVDADELLGGTLFLCDAKSASAITGVVLPIDCGFAAYSGV